MGVYNTCSTHAQFLPRSGPIRKLGKQD
jgi:hypothetical protein